MFIQGTTFTLAAFVFCLASLSTAHAEPLPTWEAGLGLAAFSLPDYRGSDEVHTRVLPFPYFVYRQDWLKIDRNGLKSRLFDGQRSELNFSISGTPPVFSKHSRARQGMADIRPLLELGPSLDTHLWESQDKQIKLDFNLPVRASVSIESKPQYTGYTVSPRLSLNIYHLRNSQWQLGLRAGPLFADQNYHQYIYGVAPHEARANRPAYQAHGGYAGSMMLASLSRRYGKTWIGAYARYDNLRGAAFADSPLMRRRHYFSAGIGLAWIFGQSSTLVDPDLDD